MHGYARTCFKAARDTLARWQGLRQQQLEGIGNFHLGIRGVSSPLVGLDKRERWEGGAKYGALGRHRSRSRSL